LKERIKLSDILTLEKVKLKFTRNKSFYFTEVVYDESKKFFDLYINFNTGEVSQKQIEVYNELTKEIEKYRLEVDVFLKSTLKNFERKKETELNNKILNIDVVEIQKDNNCFDVVLVCGKQYKFFKFFKKDITIRIEIKNGQIKTMERKSDSTKENS
jgi:hypothetical protein